MPGVQGFVRKNGFQRPFSDLQVATWVLYPLIVGSFYALVLPVLGENWTSPLRLCLLVVYTLLHLWAAHAAYVVTVADPADKLLRSNENYIEKVGSETDTDIPPPVHEICYHPAAKDEYAECRPLSATIPAFASCAIASCSFGCCNNTRAPRKNSAASHDHEAPEPTASSGNNSGRNERQDFCYYCQVHVSSLSKHCRYCDKCVHGFDHHCKWLNNCVGYANYRSFLAVLVWTLSFTALQLALSIYLAVEYFGDEDGALSDRVEDVYENGDLWISLLLAFAVVVLPVAVLIAQLLHFHVVLLSRRQTTYEFVSEVHSAPRPKPRPKPRPAPGSSAAATPQPQGRSKTRRSKEGSGGSSAATEAAIAAAKAKKEAREKAAAATDAEASKNAQSEPVGEESIEAVANGGKDSKSGQIELSPSKRAGELTEQL